MLNDVRNNLTNVIKRLLALVSFKNVARFNNIENKLTTIHKIHKLTNISIGN